MNPLDEPTETEKANLIHELFPSEMPPLIEFLQRACKTIDREKDIIKLEWENQLLIRDFWFHLSAKANSVIDRYGDKLGKRSGLFAYQFFDGPVLIFILDSL
jgi:hypothetical protein